MKVLVLSGGQHPYHETTPILEEFIYGELERTGVSPDRLALVGFSQGAMMSLHVGFCCELPIAGVLGYSGRMILDQTGQLDDIKTMPIKNVCAKLAVTLVDQIDEACNVLSMSKREFIEIAITNLIAEVDEIAEKHDIYAPHIPPADFGKGDES